ncbi:MAG: hypothetical protein IIU17_02375 [Muribaculaceae bacterium]|nr:hypothetical protein [Muribaculaceae bacterium]
MFINCNHQLCEHCYYASGRQSESLYCKTIHTRLRIYIT